MIILIAESEHDTASMLEMALADMGHLAVIAKNYSETQNFLLHTQFDLLVLNKYLQGGGADEIAKEAKRRDIKTIVISTDKINNIECDHFLRAPFGLEALEKALFCKNSLDERG